MSTTPTVTGLARQLDRSRLPARAAYLGIVLVATLSALHLGEGSAPGEALRRMLHPGLAPRDVVDGVRNVVLFAGWGVVWMITAPAGRTAHELRRAVLTGFLISTVVEGAQLFSATRTASVLDVLTNTVGALFGAVAIVALVITVSRHRGDRSFVGLPTFVFAISYGIVTLGEMFAPLFRQSAFPNAYGGWLGRFHLSVGMFRWSSLAHVPLTDLVLIAPAGAFAVAALAEAGVGYRRSGWAVAMGAVALAALAEIGHAFVGYPIDAGAFLSHAVGACVGAAGAARGLPALTRKLHGRRRPAALMAAYVAVLTIWALRPFSPELSLAAIGTELTNGWWIPLRFAGRRVDLFSVADVVGPFLLYLPFGALLAVWPLTRRGWLKHFWPAVYLAVATELCQLFVQGRLLDATDLLVQAAGAVVGWAVLRRAGYGPHGTVLRARLNS